MKKFGIIYKAINLTNNKIYIGQTVSNLDKRKQEHLSSSKNKNNQQLICKAIRKYGIDNFQWEILYECSSREELDEKEKYYIRELNTRAPKGYNLTDGGGGTSGWHHSDETRIKISAVQKNKKKKPLTDETKMKIGKANSGVNNGMYGKHPTKETMNKLIEKRCKYIYILTDPNGNEYITDRLTDFCEKNNLNRKYIQRLSLGKRSHHKGWKCKKILKNIT